MKKILVVLCILGFLFSAPVAQAWETVKLEIEDFATHTVDNITGYDKTTNVSTSTITPGTHAILGYTVMSLTGHEVDGTVITGNSENYVSLWDEIAGTVAPSLMGPEIESLDTIFAEEWFPRPKPFFNGITVRQGACTRVCIMYE